MIFPRWASMANGGCGEPRFLFYPPASWTLGALLSAVVPWTLAASVYIWVALVAAGASMFLLARRWLGRRDAIFAAVFFPPYPVPLCLFFFAYRFSFIPAHSS